MKKYGLFLWLLVSGSLLSAQVNYFSLSMGSTLPIQTYAANTNSTSMGYAQSGFTMSFDGNYFLFDYLGINGTVNFGMNFTDEVKLQEDWLDYLKNLYPDVIIPSNATIDFSTTQWTYVNIMAGPILSLPISKFFFELKAKAGFSFIKPPERTIAVKFSNTEINSTTSGQSLKFGYQLGGGILYMPNRFYGIKLGAEYYSSQSSSDLNSRENNGLDNSIIKSEVLHIPVAAIHIMAGLAYSF